MTFCNSGSGPKQGLSRPGAAYWMKHEKWGIWVLRRILHMPKCKDGSAAGSVFISPPLLDIIVVRRFVTCNVAQLFLSSNFVLAIAQ